MPGRAGLLLPLSAGSVGAAALFSRGRYPTILLSMGSLLLAGASLLALHAATPTYMFSSLTLLLGGMTGVNTITTQNAFNERAPASQKGTSFGLYRTCGYLGAIGAGSQLKTVFQAGVTDASFGAVRWRVLAGSGALVVR